MAVRSTCPGPGYVLKFVRWITHPVTGRRIYPKKAKVFPIWVKI